MSNFEVFKNAVEEQFSIMTDGHLFKTDVSKDVMWDTYLKSFPEGTNPIFRERTEHDCQCCRQFIRAAGNVVAIIGNKLVSIWDVELPDDNQGYQTVTNQMAALVKKHKVRETFLHSEAFIGTDHNRDTEKPSIVWNHFHQNLPGKFVMRGSDIGSTLSETCSTKNVFKRGLQELSISAIEIILELIDQNTLYRGTEHKATVNNFLKHKKAFDKIPSEYQDNFCWANLQAQGARIRNSAIGTLLTDVSEGRDLDKAVGLFQTKVAPANYKRPTAFITKSMVEKAQKKVQELGIEDALSRRYAVMEDITINNVLFADRRVKQALNVFDEMVGEAPVNTKKLKKVEEVSIDTFIKDILPKADSLEMLFENKHTNNLVSLLAPVHAEAKSILKWNNNFSWNYNGEVTDSIKERVKKAGGSVTGVLRCSLSWFNHDDLDIHVIEPSGEEIFYSHRTSGTGGILDVDMNASSPYKVDAVENITWPQKSRMLEGRYTMVIHNYSKRSTANVGFDAEIEYDGVIYSYHYSKPVGNVEIAVFEFSKKTGIKFLSSLPSTQVSKEEWGINSENFHKVQMVMNSPNHWDGNETGNKHYFFMLEGCNNPDKARGFFNEFLNNNLQEHRKVFEVLGSKMRAESTTEQISGLGFSSTQRNKVICKVTGAFTRTVKVLF